MEQEESKGKFMKKALVFDMMKILDIFNKKQQMIGGKNLPTPVISHTKSTIIYQI